MKFGFAKQDITPRLGVELWGYSGYLNRHATAVRDKLWARAMAVGDDEKTVVIVSCDLVFMPAVITSEVRRLVNIETGLDASAIMVHATHTHSGPCLPGYNRHPCDHPYVEILPRRIAKACIEAMGNLRDAELRHAEIPCEGIGINRVYDKFNYGEEALTDGFRPAKPELTDTTAHVLSVVAEGKLIGFASYFGCHNVVGGAECTYIHGDYAGIATGRLERDHPGAIGLFLQGAEGDVNTACCCLGNDEVIPALEIISDRYANAIRKGIAEAIPLEAIDISCVSKMVAFSRREIDIRELREKLDEEEAIIHHPSASDEDPALRMAVLRARSLRNIIRKIENGESFENQTEIQGIRIGPIAFLATPFEVFQAIKNDVVKSAASSIPLVMSITNDEQGYAVDKTASENEKDYAARIVPLWKHNLPYQNIHEELTHALLDLDNKLQR